MSNTSSEQSKTDYEEYLERRQVKAVPLNVALKSAEALLKSGSPVKPFLVGGAGVGKTQGLSTLAKKMGSFLVTMMGGFATAEQERGVPVINENPDGSISFSPAARDLIAEPMAELRTNKKIVRGDVEYDSMFILFDELNQADTEVLKIFFSAFSSSSLPGLDWSDLPVHIAATGNPPIGGYRKYVKPLHHSDAWDRRLGFFYIEDATYPAWARWAKKDGGVCGEVISFLKSEPQLLHPGRNKEEKVPTPATWVAVSQILSYGLDMKERATAAILEGMLGSLTGLKFRQFCLEGGSDALSSDELLELPWTQVQEYIEDIVKTGRLAQLAVTIRNLADHICDVRPDVSGCATRCALILMECPRDTQSVWNTAVKESKERGSVQREAKITDYFEAFDTEISHGPAAAGWTEMTIAASNFRMR